MHHEWMTTMERRVNNFQVTSEELQVIISHFDSLKTILNRQFLEMVKQ